LINADVVSPAILLAGHLFALQGTTRQALTASSVAVVLSMGLQSLPGGIDAISASQLSASKLRTVAARLVLQHQYATGELTGSLAEEGALVAALAVQEHREADVASFRAALNRSLDESVRDREGLLLIPPGPLRAMASWGPLEQAVRRLTGVDPQGVAHALATIQQQQAEDADALMDGPRAEPGVPGLRDADPSRVVVTTLCAYNASRTRLGAISLANKRAYCRLHGYACRLETTRDDLGRHPAWGKLRIVRRALDDLLPAVAGAAGQSSPAFDWVVWLDCDSIITNPSVSIAEAFHHDQPIGRASSVPLRHAAPSLLLSEDAQIINTGAFAARNTAVMRRILDEAWGSQGAAAQDTPEARRGDASPFVDHEWWEQAAVAYALMQGPKAASYWGAVGLVPQHKINAYPIEVALGGPRFLELPLHAVWRPGDFVVSFSGCRALGSGLCNALFETYFALAEHAFLEAE
jgi:hypothetical protein